MVLQILFFGPSDLLNPQESFDALVGKLIVSPVVKTLVFEKVPEEVSGVKGGGSDWVPRC